MTLTMISFDQTIQVLKCEHIEFKTQINYQGPSYKTQI
jgi:hypothetical protein